MKSAKGEESVARPSLDQNPKFKLLVRRLGVPRPYVLGLLETMWRVAWENGEPIIGTPDEIEASAEWPGEPGKFHAALVSGRLLDDVGDGRWSVHDFWDHAPEYVKKRRVRELERQQRGRVMADNGRKRRPKSAKRRTTAKNGHTPAPAPAPAPPTEKDTTETGRAPGKKFIPPTAEEVQGYLDEVGERRFTGEAFVDAYRLTGWKVKGGNPIKDWQAAVRNWRHMRDQRGEVQSAPKGKPPTLCRDCKQPMTKIETMEGTTCRACREDHGV
jgi:hypothetical protein